jgi:hypothetical protein
LSGDRPSLKESWNASIAQRHERHDQVDVLRAGQVRYVDGFDPVIAGAAVP